jgi:hypothetical protein
MWALCLVNPMEISSLCGRLKPRGSRRARFVARQPTTQQQDSLFVLARDLVGRDVGIVVQAVIRRRRNCAAPGHTVTMLVRKRHHVTLRGYPGNLQICGRLGNNECRRRLGCLKSEQQRNLARTHQNHDHEQDLILIPHFRPSITHKRDGEIFTESIRHGSFLDLATGNLLGDFDSPTAPCVFPLIPELK